MNAKIHQFSEDVLHMLGILSIDVRIQTQKIENVVKEELAKKRIDLYDINFEFGRTGEDQQIVLFDEISGGNMRTYKLEIISNY